MKLKQFILAAIITLTVVSCSKQDITVPQQETSTQTNAIAVTSTSTPETNNFAYVFIEPKNKQTLIVNYLKDSVQHSTGIPFLGFNMGYGITASNKNDILNYINLKYWYNGQLPAVRMANISQTNYNMDSLSIMNSTINDNSSWVTILIPVSAMNNDVYKQKTVKIGGTGIKTNVVTMNSTIYNYTLDYNGNNIPKGRYRMYTTFVSPTVRFDLSKSGGNIFIKGNSN
jgi:hypothetical protein